MNAISEVVERGAELSPCGRYRYLLWRQWETQPRTMLFIGLNPSTADAHVDDPTIRRMVGYARREGFGRVTVVNLYAWRATDPLDLVRATEHDIVGPATNDHIRQAIADSGVVIACWGSTLVRWRPQRVDFVEEVAARAGSGLFALGVTKRGDPRHPLYLRRDAPLAAWESP